MSDKTTQPTDDDVLEHAPVEDYSGDDTADAHGRIQQPSDAEYAAADWQATADDTADTAPAPDSSRDG
jgi:hypothetical protein